MSACWIALGGNQGAVAQTFDQALALLDQTSEVDVVQCSRIYTTDPVGSDSGSQFLNATAELSASLGPHQLLDLLHAIETQLGRVRSRRWGPRTLDLDLLFYDQEIVSTDSLTIPHPHLWYRRFVLDPLVEISPDFIHPQHRVTVSELQRRLLPRPLPCLLWGGVEDERRELQNKALAEAPDICWTELPGDASLVFSLEADAESVAAISSMTTRVIVLPRFPTPPSETIRDVLTSALAAARVA